MKPRIYANRKRFVDGISGCLPRVAIEFLGQYVMKKIPVFYESGSPCFVIAAFDSTQYFPKYKPVSTLEIWKCTGNDAPELIILNIPLSAS